MNDHPGIWRIERHYVIALLVLAGIGGLAVLLYAYGRIGFLHQPPEDYECSVQVTRDVNNKLFVTEHGVCKKYISYKNLPQDTKLYNLGGDGEDTGQGSSKIGE